MYIENKLVVDRVTEYGVRYNDPVSGEDIYSPQNNIHAAKLNAKKLDGHVVQHMVFISAWESVFDDPSAD